MKKNYILLFLIVLFSQLSFAQTVAIGTPGTTTNQAIPVEPYYGYTYAQCIYTKAELNTAGITGVKQIDTLIFEYNSTTLTNSDAWVVYLGHTSKSTFASSTDWEPLSSLTQVFNGTVSVTVVSGGNNLVKVALSSPFYWDGVSNLMVAVDENKANYGSSSNDFYCRSTTGTRSICYRSDPTNPDPASPPSATFQRSYVPNLSIAYSTPPSCLPPSALTATGITATDATLGWTELGTAMLWEYEYGAPGFTLGTGTRDTTSSNPKTITGLSSLTNYEYYVRSKCSATDSSTWSGPYAFLTACASQLSGIYTLDPASPASATNFTTMASFMSFLSNCGVSGPTTLNVSPTSGPHIMGQDLGAYPGMSAANPVVINGNGTTVNRGTGTYFLALNGVKHFSVMNFMFINETPATSMYGIMMRGGCDSLLIKNNTINVGTGYTTSLSCGVCASNSLTSATSNGNNANNVTIDSNTIIGAYYGIALRGTGSTTKSKGHKITNNIMQDQYVFGIYNYYGDSILFHNNDISRPTRTTLSTFYGIESYYSVKCYITNNKIHDGGSGNYTTYAIYFGQSSNSAGNESYVVNNAIYNNRGTSTMYGLYLVSTMSHLKIYHNTVEHNTTGSGSTIRGIYRSSTPNNEEYRNNLVSIYGSGTGSKWCYYSSSSTTFTGGNNLFYMGATGGTNNHPAYFSGNQATIAAWSTASSTTGNSDVNPSIIVGTYTPLAGTADNGGSPLPTVPTDIDGATRSATTPDFGAVEFVGLPGDMSLTNIWLNEASLCYGTADTAYATIKNEFGTTVDFSVDNLTVNWSIAGPVPSTGTTTLNSGTLAVGASMDVYVTTVNMSIPGVYTVSAYIDTNAVNKSATNDTLTDHSTFDKKAMIEVNPEFDTVYVLGDSAKISTKSPFFPGGAFFITEVCHYAGASTGRPAGGKPSWLIADDYIEVTGVPGSDLGGYTYERWSSSSMTLTYTFPSGTILSSTGTAILGGGTNAPNVTNSYYSVGGSTDVLGSSTTQGHVLKDASGNVVDAVGYYNYNTFPAASGVTTSDWATGFSHSSSTWGTRLTGADVNSATNWILSSSSNTQDPNTLNAGVTAPAPSSVSGLQWTDLTTSTALDTTPEIWVKGWTTNGTYPYEVSYVTPCGTFADTAYVTFLQQTLDTVAPITVCDTFLTPLGGNVVTTSGYPTDTIFGVNPVYDSIIRYYPLTVNNSTAETIAVAICDSLVSPSGKSFKTTGTYLDTIPNVIGCDSVITINLTITTTTFLRDTITICDSEVWRGMTLTTSGIYYDTIFTGSCDSIYIHNLTVNYKSTASFTQFVCDSLVSPSGKVWNTNGTFIDTIPNALGCDSIMTFNLTFGYISYGAPVTLTVCDSYTSPSGKVWTTSGTYLDTVVNASGCDSAMTFNLTVNYNKTKTDVITVCDSYTRPGGIPVNYSGTFIDTIPTVLGCDSVVTTVLTVNYTTSSTITATVCGSYTSPSGKVWLTSGSRFDTIPNASGCDSLMTIIITVKANTSETRTVSACFSYTVPETGNVYTTSGTYTDVTTNAFGCPHTITTNLTINTANAGTITLSGTTFTASATGVSYRWADCDNNYSHMLHDTNQTFTPVRNGNFACIITTADGCSDTTNCLSVNTVSLEEFVVTENDISIYPNPASYIVNIDILRQNANEDVTVRLFDAIGKLVYTKTVSSTNNKVSFDVSTLEGGVYTVSVSNEFFTTTKKLTVVN